MRPRRDEVDWRRSLQQRASDLLLTVVSKKEALHLRKILREEDPNSFIIMDEDVSVAGNFQKRL